MPLPRYEEVYAWWLKRLAEKRAEQYANEYPSPRYFNLPLSRRRLLLVLLLALVSCGLMWWACKAIVGG